MNGFDRLLLASLVIALVGAPSCRKPEAATKSDLKEAGYQFTTEDWLRASGQNDVSAMKKFVAGKFATDSRNQAGDSALHIAAFTGSRNSAEYLLNRGLSIDLPGASQQTPLMSAVIGDQTTMVSWLLRQGADPRAKDINGFSPLMLAVRDGRSGSVAELAPYHREMLDPAILLAALVGQTEVIDTLTNYGSSVYARMEDGRTPLMIAAENGHTEAVELLLDIGSSRFSTNAAGETATALATAAGHTEIAALISRDPIPGELALESSAEIAQSMDAYVDAAIDAPPADETLIAGGPVPNDGSAETGDSSSVAAVTAVPNPNKRAPSRPIQGETLSASVTEPSAVAATAGNPQAAPATNSKNRPPLPPLVMRHYREREMPVEVQTVQGENATLKIQGSPAREVTVSAGDPVPESRLVVVRVQRRMEDSKLNLGQATEVSVVEVRDTATGNTREWISGVPSSAHDPVALVEDSATGQRYTATPGQRFKSADGSEFIVSDVRPNQIIIEDSTTGAVQTIPLRGPRG